MRADPDSIKKTVKLSIFFALLRSACAKAACITLMKLTPGHYRWVLHRVYFINLFTERGVLLHEK